MQPSLQSLESGLDIILQSPKSDGLLQCIVRRPEVEKREEVPEAELDLTAGMVGDNWFKRGSSRTKDGTANLDAQLTLMNSRVIDLIAQSRDRWALAGDQLFVDLDLSHENLPAGSRLAVGSAILEISEEPHAGCSKFMARFGTDALKFVNSPRGKQLRLRGLNAKIVKSGRVKVGDKARKVEIQVPA